MNDVKPTQEQACVACNGKDGSGGIRVDQFNWVRDLTAQDGWEITVINA